MIYFPVFFDLAAQKVLVVGGGEVALRKVALLERTGAAISLVAPEILPELMERAGAGKISLSVREFAPDDLIGARLVIVATSRRAVNRWIATLSEARGRHAELRGLMGAAGRAESGVVDGVCHGISFLERGAESAGA